MIRKPLPLACLTFVLTVAIPVKGQNAPDVELYGFVWKTVSVVDHTVKFDASKTGDKKEDYGFWSVTPPYQGRQTSVFYEPEVTVENHGQKTIQAIAWECVFFRDAAKSHVLKRYKFHTKQMVAAGERSVLKGGQRFRVVHSAAETLRVLRVEYTDGSRWQAP
jgi:hypothetical protein